MKNSSQPSVFSMSSSFLLLFIFLSTLNSCSYAASDSIYNTFVQCLSTNTKNNQISQIVYSPSNTSFTKVLTDYIRNPRFNTSTTRKPSLIITPLNVPQVQATVICTKQVGIEFKIRSGGHDYEGISYVSEVPFVILDMFNLRSINVSVTDQTAWVQSGAILGELYYNIWQNSKVLGFPAGVSPTVGVGGHISGGGYGNMLRKYGLSVDNMIDAQVVDAKGQVLDRKGMGEDFFWALQGGGGASFGVVIAYKIKLVPVPPVVTVFRITKTLEENATDLFYRWQFVANKVDDNLFIRTLIQPTSKKSSTSPNKAGDGTVKVTFIALFLGNANGLLSVLGSQFPDLKLTKQDVTELSWIQSVLFWANFDVGTSEKVLLDRTLDSESFFKRKSDYLKTPIPREGLEGLWQNIIQLGKAGMVFNAYGGKMDEIAETATPFPHRAGNIFKIQYFANWKVAGPEAETQFINQTRVLYDYMTPFVSKNPRESFLNYRDLDIGTTNNGNNTYNEAKVYGTKYFKGNFDRLVKVKSAVDPENFFRNEQSIPPLPK